MTVDQVLEVVQLTDSHLFATPDEQLLGLSTAESLQHVIALVQAERPALDLVLATGDLSQDGSAASYQRFRQLSEVLAAPVRWCAGNHDEHAPMQAVAQGTALLSPVVDMGRWRITLLDSSMPGQVFGYLAEEQLQLLAQALQTAPERHHLVCLHHHPVPIGSAWMDQIGLRNAHALWAVLARYRQVKVLLWGHVHQAVDQERGTIRLLATPSTCVQFAPGSQTFQTTAQLPGYRWLRLHADGRVETGVSRLAKGLLAPVVAAQGY